MKPVVLGFSGRIGSGKSTLANFVAKSLQAPCVSFGDYVRSVADFIGLDTNDRMILQDLGSVLVKRPKILCANVLAQANYQPGDMLVIDGVRHREIADELRRQVSPARFILVYVNVSEDRIEETLTEEGNTDKDVDELVLHSTETQVSTILAGAAEIVVDNSRVRPVEEVVNELIDGLKRFTDEKPVTQQSVDDFYRWVNETRPSLLKHDKNTGVTRIKGTRINVVDIIQEVIGLGRDIKEVVAQHPHLSQDQVREALTHYEVYRNEVNEEIQQRYEETEALRRQAKPRPTREELEKRLRDKTAGTSHG